MIPKSGVRFSDKIMRKKGGEAPKGACQPCRRTINKRCRLRVPQARLRAIVGGAPAFRRFTAALATGYYPDGSAPDLARCALRKPGSRCPRADECDPLPGGSGAPVGRQKDRYARSVLNSRRYAASGQNQKQKCLIRPRAKVVARQSLPSSPIRPTRYSTG